MARDNNQVFKTLPIIVGALGGMLLLVNRFLTPELTDSQARSDALGVLLSALLIFTGLLWQQVQPRSPEAVELIGKEGFELAPNLPETVRTELAWASLMLLTNSATCSVVVWHQGKVLLRRGILGVNPEVKPGAILQRVIEKQKPVYLVDLKLYPGRIEFDYLPKKYSRSDLPTYW